MQHYDPEVSLAVKLGVASQTVVTEKDEEDGLDEFFSTHGFEYVDGDRAGRRPTADGGSFSDEDSMGALFYISSFLSGLSSSACMFQVCQGYHASSMR